ncbi:uncharacterized protein LOC121108875 isoform X4 [Gallus gallus]|uniref:uncharacterized protein LOC121108875 isoform X4 n=1 Tax=Gallus gallus TaxID=9031 RepID=UPI001AE55BD1|nr:uncharacterized protein LOC121108875 isoform X4 [Gallus gallus]
MEADLQERTAALLRRSEAVLNQRPRTPRTHPAPPLCGRGQPAGGRSLDEDPLQRWRANRRRGFTEAPPPVTSTRRRSQSLEAARGAEPRRQRSQSDETVPPAPWGSAMGQKAAAIELLQEAMDSDEAEAVEDAVLQALRDRRRRLRGMLRSVEALLAAPPPPL